MADRQDLERVQKAAVKVILGKDYVNYDEALSELKLESLEKRRAEQCTPSTSASVIATTTNESDHEYDAPDPDTSDEAMPPRKRLRTKIECNRSMEIIARYHIPIRVAHMFMNAHSLDLNDALKLNKSPDELLVGRTQVSNQVKRSYVKIMEERGTSSGCTVQCTWWVGQRALVKLF